MDREEIINKIHDIQEIVLRSKVVSNPEELEGKVIDSIKTILMDGISYMVTKTSDGHILCASYTKCGDSFIMDNVPKFDINELAMEELDFGYSNHSFHVFDLYLEMGVLSIEDHEFINVHYSLIKERAQVCLNISRLEYSIKNAVDNEDFKKASELKKELNELKKHN